MSFARGTNAWLGVAKADSKRVAKDPKQLVFTKDVPAFKPEQKWIDRSVMVPGASEPDHFRVPGPRSVPGAIATEFHPSAGLTLLRSILGDVTSTQYQHIIKTIITVDGSSATITYQINSETAIVLDTTADKEADNESLFSAINGVSGSVVVASYFNSSDHSAGLLLTADNPFILTITPIGGNQVTQTIIQAGGYWHHLFKGSDNVALPEGISLTALLDIIQKNAVGIFPTSLALDFKPGAIITANYNLLGLDAFNATGSAGTSQGENAISLSVTLVASTSDQIKLAVDGGTAIEITIAAGVYTTAIDLATAINDAILATATLLDTDRRPIVACFIDENDKVNFYSGFKGTSSAVVWTAGTNNAGTLLGRGTPVEAAGTNTPPEPDYPTIQPFVGTQVIVTVDSAEIEAEELKLEINNSLKMQEVLGLKFAKRATLGNRRQIKGSFKEIFQDTSLEDKFKVGTAIAILATADTGEKIGASNQNYAALIRLPICYITKAPTPATSGFGPIPQTVEFYLRRDDTYNDIQIEVWNDLPGFDF